MVKQTKLYEVDNLRAKINDSKGFFLVGYQGWDANLFNLLRHTVSQKGGHLKVVRNNLFSRAIKDLTGREEKITGPTACLFSLVDEVTPLSVLCNFLKENNLDPDLKLGFLTKTEQPLDSQEAFRLAKLPSVDNLRAMLVGGLSANLSKLVITLNSPIRSFTLLLKVLQENKGVNKQ